MLIVGFARREKLEWVTEKAKAIAGVKRIPQAKEGIPVILGWTKVEDQLRMFF
jgi:hypothetical protein